MPNEFTALRARARARRDKIIAEAKAEYESALKQIAVLEQDLLGKETQRHVKISTSIDRIIPKDRPFTTLDIMAALEASQPGRVWRPGSINNHMSWLRKKGIVKRLRKSNGTTPAIYAVKDLDVSNGPFGDATLGQAVAKVLTSPMTQTELVVALLEAGYRTTMKREYLRNAVGEVLRKGGYRCEGGKWQR
jgi:hypothetical protein